MFFAAMVAVIFVVPVAFMHLPALLIMVVVRVAPIGASVGRSLPAASSPDVTSSYVSPVSIGPYVAFARHGWTGFVAEWWWGSTDIDVDLSDGGSGEGSQYKTTGQQVQFPV
jgi:hypothetical protein